MSADPDGSKSVALLGDEMRNPTRMASSVDKEERVVKRLDLGETCAGVALFRFMFQSNESK